MGKIAVGRVIIGGLVAGLIINISESVLHAFILGPAWMDYQKIHNFGGMTGGGSITMIVLLFILGLVAVWLYAAIRPRFGAGPKTAIYAGLVIWLLVSVMSNLGGLAVGVYTSSIAITMLLWTLVEMPLATFVGAWIYREEEGAGAEVAAPEPAAPETAAPETGGAEPAGEEKEGE